MLLRFACFFPRRGGPALAAGLGAGFSRRRAGVLWRGWMDFVPALVGGPATEKSTKRFSRSRPVTWSVIGVGAGLVFAPILTAVAGIGSAMAELSLEVERRSPGPDEELDG